MPPLTICPQTHSTRSIHNLGDDDGDDEYCHGDEEDALKHLNLIHSLGNDDVDDDGEDGDDDDATLRFIVWPNQKKTFSLISIFVRWKSNRCMLFCCSFHSLHIRRYIPCHKFATK